MSRHCDIGPDYTVYCLEEDFCRLSVENMKALLECEVVDDFVVMKYDYLAEQFFMDPQSAAQHLHVALKTEDVKSQLDNDNKVIRIKSPQENRIIEMTLYIEDMLQLLHLMISNRNQYQKYLARKN